MSKIVVSFITASLTFSPFAHAANNVCSNDYGKMQCAAGEVNSINHLGNLTLSGTHVLGQLTVVGNVEANNAEVGSGDITGIVDASHLTVQKQLSSIGKFHAVNSVFNGELKLTGKFEGKNNVFNDKADVVGDVNINNEMFKREAEFTGNVFAKFTTFSMPIKINACESTLSHSISAGVIVGAQKNCSGGSEIIRLQDQSQVKGDIRFLSGNGKVYVSKDSSVSGHVTGGVIVRE